MHRTRQGLDVVVGQMGCCISRVKSTLPEIQQPSTMRRNSGRRQRMVNGYQYRYLV